MMVAGPTVAYAFRWGLQLDGFWLGVPGCCWVLYDWICIDLLHTNQSMMEVSSSVYSVYQRAWMRVFVLNVDDTMEMLDSNGYSASGGFEIDFNTPLTNNLMSLSDTKIPT